MKNFCKLYIKLLVLIAATFAPAGAGQAQEAATAPVKQGQREMAVTIDDLPGVFANRLDQQQALMTNLLRSLTANKVPAIGFVNENKLYQRGLLDEQRVALLQAWLDAGQALGNHTFAHTAADAASLAAYQQEVIRGETVLKKLLQPKGQKLQYFRHPELKTGSTAAYSLGLEQFLTTRGYVVAPVTIDNQDFMFAAIYSNAKARGDQATMKQVAAAYISYMEEVCKFFEELSVETLGYEVKQTLLLHATELNAEHFDDLAAMLRRRGYSFVPLEQALTDAAYKLPVGQTSRGLSWLHRWRIAKGLPQRMEPREPAVIRQLYQRRTSAAGSHVPTLKLPPDSLTAAFSSPAEHMPDSPLRVGTDRLAHDLFGLVAHESLDPFF
jgi:peptidoglycan/xylan/chitin deacetylase (PgdA/CDA1 family)